MCVLQYEIWYLFEARYANIYQELNYLEDHADGEADPDPDGAAQGGNEGDQGVARRLRDCLHVEGHEVHVHSEVVILHVLRTDLEWKYRKTLSANYAHMHNLQHSRRGIFELKVRISHCTDGHYTPHQ